MRRANRPARAPTTPKSTPPLLLGLPSHTPQKNSKKFGKNLGKAYKHSPMHTHSDGRPYGMPRKAYALALDKSRFKEWLVEHGGDDEALGYVVAQVASGVSLKVIAEHWTIDYGLLWSWLSEDGERMERYELAQRGVAEYYVAESVGIADGADEEKGVPKAKLMVDTRFKVAQRWNRAKYGEAAQTQINVGANSLVAILQGLPSAQVEAERQERLAAPELIEGEAMDVTPADVTPTDITPEEVTPVEIVPEKIPEKMAEKSEPIYL